MSKCEVDECILNEFYCLPDSGLNKTILNDRIFQIMIAVFCLMLSWFIMLFSIKPFNLNVLTAFIVFVITNIILYAICTFIISILYVIDSYKYKTAFDKAYKKVRKTYKVDTSLLQFAIKKENILTVYIYPDKIRANNELTKIPKLSSIEQVIYANALVGLLKKYKCTIYKGNYVEADGEQKRTAVVVQAIKR